MSTNLYEASRQWSKRPDDERFVDLDHLCDFLRHRREMSREPVVALDYLTVKDREDGALMLTPRPDIKGLGADSRYDGIESQLTNWTFSQLCSRAHAPASFLSKLPPMFAARDLAWTLENSDRAEGKLLLTDIDGNVLRAITSPGYGRIWDIELAHHLVERIDPDVWKIPSASYSSSDPKRATTLYASDRDMFVFLVNEGNPIEVNGSKLSRGFFLWNSEVGKSKFGIKTFLYNYVCDNRIVWGVSDVKEISIIHSKGAPGRFVTEALPAMNQYLESATAKEVQVIKVAKAREIVKDKSDLKQWLKDRGFTSALASTTATHAEEESEKRGGSPTSIWNVVNGMTNYAHNLKHTDRRIDLETKAGSIMSLAEASAL